MRRSRLPLAIALGLATLSLAAAPAQAGSIKAIWGPSSFPAGSAVCAAGCSAFPTYRQLGVDVYQFQLHFDEIAPTQPANPRDPADPAYKWPSGIDQIVQDAAANGIQLGVQVQYSPPWANGGQSKLWSPDPQAFGDFLFAASRRYPSIQRWQIWGEPILGLNYLPMARTGRLGPQTYGKLVDASYVALKQASPANVVIGGSTVSQGIMTVSQFINRIRLPNGRMPRMDLWGHNPFDNRFPRLRDNPIAAFRGISDVDTLYAELTRAYRGKRSKGKAKKSAKPQRVPKLFLSEWTVVSDHPTPHFANNFFLSRQQQARYLTAAFRMIRPLKYVQGLGWFTLLDEPESPTSADWGLMTATGVPKPSFAAYAAVP
jgi:hypothetical protein